MNRYYKSNVDYQSLYDSISPEAASYGWDLQINSLVFPSSSYYTSNYSSFLRVEALQLGVTPFDIDIALLYGHTGQLDYIDLSSSASEQGYIS